MSHINVRSCCRRTLDLYEAQILGTDVRQLLATSLTEVRMRVELLTMFDGIVDICRMFHQNRVGRSSVESCSEIYENAARMFRENDCSIQDTWPQVILSLVFSDMQSNVIPLQDVDVKRKTFRLKIRFYNIVNSVNKIKRVLSLKRLIKSQKFSPYIMVDVLQFTCSQ